MFFPPKHNLAIILGLMGIHPDFLLLDLFCFRISSFQVIFLDCQIPRLLDIQISGFEAVSRRLPEHPPQRFRTTKLVRSKELGQYRKNPISASPVWGMFEKSSTKDDVPKCSC